MTTPVTTTPDTPSLQPERPSLGAGEIYAGILVLLIGLIFLALQVMSHTSSRSDSFIVKDNALILDRKELFLNLRNYIFILTAIIGSILLLKRRLFGWIAVTAILGLAILIVSWSIVQYIMLRQYDIVFGIVAAMEFFLVLALLILCSPSSRKKFRAGKIAFIPALLFLAILIGLYLLQ